MEKSVIRLNRDAVRIYFRAIFISRCGQGLSSLLTDATAPSGAGSLCSQLHGASRFKLDSTRRSADSPTFRIEPDPFRFVSLRSPVRSFEATPPPLLFSESLTPNHTYRMLIQRISRRKIFARTSRRDDVHGRISETVTCEILFSELNFLYFHNNVELSHSKDSIPKKKSHIPASSPGRGTQGGEGLERGGRWRRGGGQVTIYTPPTQQIRLPGDSRRIP
ncbi:hypothetical protein EVAR_66943_1 [Eumeta japonica]|uniref:Uncharacterized protein n=1 Tax=Eumeta variegata TaxID=151549 RepID=A0A4C1T6L1_EUMVA|nr:hypothetical protein EVAR_66943_1 [Eumeta japonica]